MVMTRLEVGSSPGYCRCKKIKSRRSRDPTAVFGRSHPNENLTIITLFTQRVAQLYWFCWRVGLDIISEWVRARSHRFYYLVANIHHRNSFIEEPSSIIFFFSKKKKSFSISLSFKGSLGASTPLIMESNQRRWLPPHLHIGWWSSIRVSTVP